jgi:putative peptidoglycan lipid II flippase
MRAHSLQRAGLLALLVVAAALLYFAVLWVGGLRLRSLLRR